MDSAIKKITTMNQNFGSLSVSFKEPFVVTAG